MVPFDVVSNAVLSVLPQTDPAAIIPLGEKHAATAYLVEDQYIFRFPRTDDDATRMRREMCLLPMVALRLPLPVPDFQFVGVTSAGLPFVGYLKIDGNSLTKDSLAKLAEQDKVSLASELAEFLLVLHETSLTQASACGVEAIDFHAHYADELARIHHDLASYLTSAELGYIDWRFHAYLDHSVNFTDRQALLHADFSGDHILYDVQQRRINGIVDFGSVIIGDPDYEFRRMAEEFGLEFIVDIAIRCQHPDPELLTKKIKFFIFSDYLKRALSGVYRHDDNRVRKGLDDLRKFLEKL